MGDDAELVGREAEIELLLAALEDARSGRGGVVRRAGGGSPARRVAGLGLRASGAAGLELAVVLLRACRRWPRRRRWEILSTPRHVLLSTWKHFLEYPTEDTLANVRCPFLFVGGAFPSDVERLRTLCPQVRVAEVRNAGHFIQLTAADAVNRILADFVADATSRASALRS